MAVQETLLAVASSWVLSRIAPGPRRSIDLLCPKLVRELTFKKLRRGPVALVIHVLARGNAGRRTPRPHTHHYVTSASQWLGGVSEFGTGAVFLLDAGITRRSGERAAKNLACGLHIRSLCPDQFSISSVRHLATH